MRKFACQGGKPCVECVCTLQCVHMYVHTHTKFRTKFSRYCSTLEHVHTCYWLRVTGVYTVYSSSTGQYTAVRLVVITTGRGLKIAIIVVVSGLASRAYENYTRGILNTSKPSGAFGATFNPSWVVLVCVISLLPRGSVGANGGAVIY